MKENNKLLAEFLGLEFEEGQDRLFIQGLGTQLIEDTFNNSWDWLMQVVDKIESLSFRVRFEMETCFIMDDNFETIIASTGHEKSKIEAVYNACVEFVEWLNKNN